MVNQKTERWAQALADALTLRLGATATAYNVTKAYDATDNTITVTVAIAAGGNNSVEAIIKLDTAVAPASGAKDSLGLTQTVFSPHIAKVLFDLNVAGAPAGSLGGTAELVRAYVMADVCRLGTRVEVYAKDAGAGNLATADIAAGNFKASVDNLDFGSIANV